MVKRNKKIKKGIEGLKKEIEKHFAKIEQDIEEKRIEIGRYHLKEIDKSLLKALEIKMEILGVENNSIERYKERLDKLKKKLEL